MNQEMPSHSQRPQRPQRPRCSGNSFEFITFTNPGMTKTATNQWRDFHRRSDILRRRKNEIEVDISPLLKKSVQSTNGGVWDAEQSGACQARTSLFTFLGASHLDPFVQYPIEMGYRERELYDHRESGLSQEEVES
jgi:hypothetical protein